jgi:hypothetical protein
MPKQRDDVQDYNDARQGLIDAGIKTASREEWIERTGQDPLDPSTWNRSIVDVIREQQAKP